MKNEFTIMLPVHRSNILLANECLKGLLGNSDLNIVCIDDWGKDKDYVKNSRISFIHNRFFRRQALVKIWNQCIKECPTDNIIIASWRQRPTHNHFKLIEEKLNQGYGMVTFDGLHFFAFNKYLTTVIGFFDEGFTRGQYEDSDWFHRLKTHNIAIYMGEIEEQRNLNGKEINSMWLDGVKKNKKYYDSKWIEDVKNKQLIQLKDEVNFKDRFFFKGMKPIKYKPWNDSVLAPILINYYFNVYPNFIKKF